MIEQPHINEIQYTQTEVVASVFVILNTPVCECSHINGVIPHVAIVTKGETSE